MAYYVLLGSGCDGVRDSLGKAQKALRASKKPDAAIVGPFGSKSLARKLLTSYREDGASVIPPGSKAFVKGAGGVIVPGGLYDARLRKEPGAAIAWVDGSADANKKVSAYGGVLILSDGRVLPFMGRVSGSGRCGTSCDAEVRACLEAIYLAVDQGVRRLTIMTDISSIVTSSINSLALRTDARAYALLRDYVASNACGRMRIELEHVASHTGIPGNETADALANAARVGASLEDVEPVLAQDAGREKANPEGKASAAPHVETRALLPSRGRADAARGFAARFSQRLGRLGQAGSAIGDGGRAHSRHQSTGLRLRARILGSGAGATGGLRFPLRRDSERRGEYAVSAALEKAIAHGDFGYARLICNLRLPQAGESGDASAPGSAQAPECVIDFLLITERLVYFITAENTQCAVKSWVDAEAPQLKLDLYPVDGAGRVCDESREGSIVPRVWMNRRALKDQLPDGISISSMKTVIVFPRCEDVHLQDGQGRRGVFITTLTPGAEHIADVLKDLYDRASVRYTPERVDACADLLMRKFAGSHEAESGMRPSGLIKQ